MRATGGGLWRRVQVLAAVVVLLVIGVLAVAVGAANATHAALNRRSERWGPAASGAAALLADFVDEETGVRGYLLTGNRRFLTPYDAAQARVPGRFRSLSALLADREDLQGSLQRVREAHDAWLVAVARPEVAAAERGDADTGRRLEASGLGIGRFDTLRAESDVLHERIEQARGTETRTIARGEGVLEGALVLAIVLVLLLTGLITFTVSRWLIRPFDRVRGAVDAVARGALDTEVPRTGLRELAELGGSVETMRARLVTALADARRGVEALGQQGPTVLALRDAMRPSCATLPGLDLVARLDPAEGVLAGDWFDAVDISPTEVGLVVGDVSGHGAEAGVFALRLRDLLSAALATGMAPDRAAQWAVARLGDTGERFATAFIAILEPSSGLLRYTNAGHPDAVLLGGAGGREVRRLEPTGPILSALLGGDGAWRTEQAVLEPGDVLLAVTDGLIEARDEAGEELGLDALVEAAGEAAGGASGDPQRTLDLVFASVARHAPAHAADDRTAVAVTRTPVPGTSPAAPGQRQPSAPLPSAPLPSAPLPSAPLPSAPLPSAPLPSAGDIAGR